MNLNAQKIAEKLKEKLLQRISGATSERESHASGKSSVACKCPRCGLVHRSFMEWTGRGTPRIFCHNCRPMVGAFCGLSIEYSNFTQPKRVRRLGHLAAE